MSDSEQREFFNINDGLTGRPPGVYLDMIERREGEILRARMEGREPDLSDEGKLPATVGTPMVVAEQRVDNKYYSVQGTQAWDLKDGDVDPVQTLEVDLGTDGGDVDLSYAAQIARERRSEEDALMSGTDQESQSGQETGERPATEPRTEPSEEPLDSGVSEGSTADTTSTDTTGDEYLDDDDPDRV